jgi:hypothetical protein
MSGRNQVCATDVGAEPQEITSSHESRLSGVLLTFN